MTIIPITSDASGALETLPAYPAIIALPIHFKGATSARPTAINPGNNPKIVSARYTLSRHRLDISIESSDSLLQVYHAKVSSGPVSLKRSKTLRVRVMSIPRGFHSSEHPGLAVDLAGTRHRLTQRKYMAYFKTALFNCLEAEMLEHGFADKVDCSKLNKSIAARIDFEKLMSIRYMGEQEKKIRIAARVLGCLASDPGKLNIKDIVEAGFLRDYPVVDVPYCAFHAYDMCLEKKFIGLMQLGGAPNNTMNARTANKLSRIIGESVDYKQLLRQLIRSDAHYATIGPDTRVYCLCAVNKTTKGAR